MKKIPVGTSSDEDDNPNPPRCLVYDKDQKGWVVSTQSKKIDYLILAKDEWFKMRSGNFKEIYPEFDSTKHYYSVDSYRPEVLGLNDVGVSIFEYQIDQKSTLPYGCFVFRETSMGTVLRKFEVSTDNYIDIGRTEGSDLYKDFLEFREKSLASKIKRRNRKGILLYGPPGNSKTTEICKLAANAEKDKFRVIFIGSKDVEFNSIAMYKSLIEDEFTIFVIEEITERIQNPEELLSFLDGETSWKNCYTIATTNHPEQLPWNIIDRPGRFKVIKEFAPPNADQRKKFLEQIGFPVEQIEEGVKATEGLSLDYLINISYDALDYNEPILKVVDHYKKDRQKVATSFKKSMGMR